MLKHVVVFLVGKNSSSSCSRIIIKIGTAAIFDSQKSKIKEKVIKRLSKDVSKLIKKGYKVLLVSSGAVGCGKKYICGEGIGVKQAQASIGQIKLMEIYSKYFKKYGLVAAQFLLNPDDLRNKLKLKNLREAYSKMDNYIVPIVNENDVTSIGELSFGDNDSLSCELVLKLDFDTLLILTEVGALIRNGRALELSNFFNVEDYDVMKIKANGFGGLKMKLDCAKILVDNNKRCIVGKAENSVLDVLNKKVIATEFVHNNFKYVGE